MPEGDNIHTLAKALRPRLTGLTVTGCEVGRLFRGPTARFDGQRLAGRTVTSVEALGKHLLLRFDDDQFLRSHLGMYGSWHQYSPCETWRRPAQQASLVLHFPTLDLVCFRAKELELLHCGEIRAKNFASRLGPDLMATGAKHALGDIVARLDALASADTPLVDVVLDQRIASGLGNEYKSELLFILRLHPLMALGELSAERRRELYSLAIELMRRNLGPRKRRTRFVEDGQGHRWVFERHGLPCLRCNTGIVHARLGRHHRPTYWCPHCQPQGNRSL